MKHIKLFEQFVIEAKHNKLNLNEYWPDPKPGDYFDELPDVPSKITNDTYKQFIEDLVSGPYKQNFAPPSGKYKGELEYNQNELTWKIVNKLGEDFEKDITDFLIKKHKLVDKSTKRESHTAHSQAWTKLLDDVRKAAKRLWK